jgi:alpha-tubulin suppressor-like RCC1 family protein
MGDSLNTLDIGEGRSAAKISCGFTHTCAVLDDGSVKCWGSDTNGCLGQGTTTSISQPPSDKILLGGGEGPVGLGNVKATDVKCGLSFTCVLLR